MKNRSLIEFVEAIDNDRPTPGGGAVAPYVGALSVALLRMGGHISFKKDSFITLDSLTKDDLLVAFNRLKDIEVELLNLMNEDSSAYQMVMTAIKLPKEDPLRREAVKRTLIAAFDVPARIAQLLIESFHHFQQLNKYIEGAVRSDLFVAYALLKSALVGAAVTMKANITALTRDDLSPIWGQLHPRMIDVISEIDRLTTNELGDI